MATAHENLHFKEVDVLGNPIGSSEAARGLRRRLPLQERGGILLPLLRLDL